MLNHGRFTAISFPLGHLLNYTNWILWFNSTYTAAHLTTHRDIRKLQVKKYLGLDSLQGFFGFDETTGVFSAAVSNFTVWDEELRLVVLPCPRGSGYRVTAGLI
jgi:hypothetical protein